MQDIRRSRKGETPLYSDPRLAHSLSLLPASSLLSSPSSASLIETWIEEGIYDDRERVRVPISLSLWLAFSLRCPPSSSFSLSPYLPTSSPAYGCLILLLSLPSFKLFIPVTDTLSSLSPFGRYWFSLYSAYCCGRRRSSPLMAVERRRNRGEERSSHSSSLDISEQSASKVGVFFFLSVS